MEKKLEATARLIEVMNRLRVECPWDREQTIHSLRNNTIEETFELVDAITADDMEGIKEELGDLFLHIVFYSKIGEEQGAFDLADVANGVCDKLIYRHPHVYGDVLAESPEEVKQNWEALKLRKKARKSGVLGGVPRSLPAVNPMNVALGRASRMMRALPTTILASVSPCSFSLITTRSSMPYWPR